MSTVLTADTAELAAQLESAVAGAEFSGVVHVSVGGEVVFAAGYGLADRAARIANTVDTRFGTASATKLITALGIGVLVDDAVLALSTRLVDVLPDRLPGVDPAVTIGQLLSHTSGVYDYYDEDLITDFDNFELPIPPSTLLRPSDYLPMLTGPQKFPPGERFSYSNGGYVLLGLVIEELTGSFHDHLERRVLQPSGMRHSGFFRMDQLPPGTAIGYLDDGRTNFDALPIIGGPDGGMFATATDLAGLWRCFLDGQVVSPGLVRTYTTEVTRCRDDLGYGHGVWIRHNGDHPPIVFMEGCDAGVSVRSSVYPERTIATVMSNSTDGAWPVAKTVDQLIRA